MGFRGVLGHEFVGQTETGQRVVAEINNSCGTCPTCLAGMGHHCPRRTVLGILNHDGAMADIVMVPSRNIHAIPDHVDDHEAIFIEPLAAAFRISEQLPISVGARVAVLGDGKLGILCAKVMNLSGAKVDLIGKHSQKLVLAGDSVQTHLVDQVDRLAKSFDIVIDATGSPTGLATAMTLVRPLGTIILKTTVAGEYLTNLAPIVIDEIHIIGSRCGPFPRAIEALSRHEIDVLPLIECELPLEEVDEAFRLAGTKGKRKVLLRVK